MNKSDQTTIITALEKNNLSYDEIRFSQVGKVSVRVVVEDQNIIKLAQCGIFSDLRNTAIKIWDTLGSSRDNENDIEYFVIFCEGVAFAVYNIYPDMERATYSAKDKVQSGWTEEREEILLQAAIEIEEGEDLEEVIQEVMRVKFVGFTVASVRNATIRFRKDILTLLPDYEKIKITKIKEGSQQLKMLEMW
jgi:hypothetical protein